jgi:hypothetical protein
MEEILVTNAMALEGYPSLDWSFGSNHPLRTRFASAYASHPAYLADLDCWFTRLRQLPIANIATKMAEAQTVPDWFSRHAELKFAEFFADHGLPVKLLVGRVQGMAQPPDMVVGTEPSHAFVEVKRITQDESREQAIAAIEETLEATGRHHVAMIQFGYGITQVALTISKREELRNKTQSVGQEFQEKYSPTMPDGTRLELSQAVITLFRVSAGQGAVGPILSMPYTSPNPEIAERIRRDLREKAAKAASWTGPHRHAPYLIGLYCEHLMIHRFDIGPIFGERRANENIFLEGKALARVNGVLLWLTDVVSQPPQYYFPNPQSESCSLPTSFAFLTAFRRGLTD